jgi:NADH-quinone oxidoreductase subunit I
MRRTGYYFTHHKEIITQQYPDNRETLNLAERFRGEVVMKHDENNEHACTGCTACELACPNATIKIITKFDITPEGKKKKALDTFIYHPGALYHVQSLYRSLSDRCHKNGAII